MTEAALTYNEDQSPPKMGGGRPPPKTGGGCWLSNTTYWRRPFIDEYSLTHRGSLSFLISVEYSMRTTDWRRLLTDSYNCWTDM